MALADILRAITQETDEHIAGVRAEHAQWMQQLQKESDAKILEHRRAIQERKTRDMAVLSVRADAHVAMRERHLLLEQKRLVLDEAYQSLLEKLRAQPEQLQRAFLEKCLAAIPGDGTIHPTAAHEALLKELADTKRLSFGKPVRGSGGFRFSSETEERTYTYEFLAEYLLRPETEVDAAHRLFT